MHAIILFPSIIQQNIDRKGSLVFNFIKKKKLQKTDFS